MGMAVDAQLQFSQQQDFAGSGALNSTNIVDMGVGNRQITHGEELYLNVTETDNLGGGTSVVFGLNTSAAEDMSGAAAIFATQAIPLATLQALGKFVIPLSTAMSGSILRYLRVAYTRTGTFTGTISSYLGPKAAVWSHFVNAMSFV